MLTHTRDVGFLPSRVAILGAGGFVGGAIAGRLEAKGTPILRIARADVDLLDAAAPDRLAGMLRPTDAVIVVSARAPCKTPAMLEENIRMVRSVCSCLELREVDHVVYVSSDAVYADSADVLTEQSCAAPESLHGAMHLAREVMLRSVVSTATFAVLRPTLIYGAADPHNGYGPNRFLRDAAAGKEIVLFGEGEERRDHIAIGDVAELAARIVLRRSEGVLNATTGIVTSFREIADMASAMFEPRVKVRPAPRKGPMPHNGLRAFDASVCRAAFPDFSFTPLDRGLADVRKQVKV